MEEIRKDVVGYEWYYKVSSFGRVMWLINQQKQYRERILRPSSSTWYCHINLCKDWVRKTGKIHRLVAESFISNPENKNLVNHKNGIKTDNRVENLEWVSYSENRLHSQYVLWNTYINELKSSRAPIRYSSNIFSTLTICKNNFLVLEDVHHGARWWNEQFAHIPWYEWMYLISNLWTVISIKSRYNRRLNTSMNKWYVRVTLNDWCSSRTRGIHRLVANTFIPNPESKPQVNHINWVRNDNRAENLEWVTSSENQMHAYKTLWRINGNKGKFWKDSSRSKKYNQHTLAWDFVKVWYGTWDIHRELWLSTGDIIQCAKGKQKTCWWFLRSYAD